MNQTRPPRAVIFDFDGVILESAGIKTEAFLEVFAHYPQHQEAILEHHLENVGISRYRKFEWIYRELLRKPLAEEESRRLGIRFSEIALAKILKCPFVPGARETLEVLSSSSLLFVASGTPQEELELIIGQRGLKDFFSEVWGTPREKSDIICSISLRFELAVDDIVFIGDGMTDYMAAKDCGVRFLARTNSDAFVNWEGLGLEPMRDLHGVPHLLGVQEVKNGVMG